jgi:hypothetical protein
VTRGRLLGLVIAIVFAWAGIDLGAAPVAVRYTEGLVHGFLALRTLDGRTIADGELSQTAMGAEESERLDLPPDLANGLISTLLKNVRPESPPTLSYLAATPKPRLVKLAVSTAAPGRFTTGSAGGAPGTTSSR